MIAAATDRIARSNPPSEGAAHAPDGAAPAFPTVAALYVETGGCYFNLPGVEPWDEARDARLYDGPHPVVAHPPCERWGRMWFGSPEYVGRTGKRLKMGDDKGCFAAALAAVRKWGGVLEHPEASRAWDHYGLNRPPRSGGWVVADFEGGWTCYVEQGHYGHAGRKGTWLYAHSVELPSLKWGHSGQRLDPIAVERYGYAKARRSGITGRIGGKFKKDARARTPEPFRYLLLAIARSARTRKPGARGSTPGRGVSVNLLSNHEATYGPDATERLTALPPASSESFPRSRRADHPRHQGETPPFEH